MCFRSTKMDVAIVSRILSITVALTQNLVSSFKKSIVTLCLHIVHNTKSTNVSSHACPHNSHYNLYYRVLEFIHHLYDVRTNT